MFDLLLELPHAFGEENIVFSEEMTQVESNEVIFTHLIWSSVTKTV